MVTAKTIEVTKVAESNLVSIWNITGTGAASIIAQAAGTGGVLAESFIETDLLFKVLQTGRYVALCPSRDGGLEKFIFIQQIDITLHKQN